MPWLKWADNETKTLVVLEEGAHQRLTHWLQNAGVDCHGSACKLCELGVKSKVRWFIEVRGPDQQYTWEMADLTYQNLVAVGESLQGLRGLRLQVKRMGLSLGTRYILIADGYAEVSAQPDPARPVWADQPVERAYTGTNGPTRAQVLSDPEGAAAVVLELCRHLGVVPRKELARWLSAEGAVYADADAAGQLAGFTQYLERRVNALPPEKEPAQPEIDLDKLFGLQ